MPETLPKPTESELEILAVLWDTGPATVREVHERIAANKEVQYSTVLKFLQIMTEKKLVNRDESQRAHVYSAARPREWTQRQLVGDLLDRAFAGSARAMVMGALSARKASKKDLAEIQALLARYSKEDSEA